MSTNKSEEIRNNKVDNFANAKYLKSIFVFLFLLFYFLFFIRLQNIIDYGMMGKIITAWALLSKNEKTANVSTEYR
jgi:hypothetical protein